MDAKKATLCVLGAGVLWGCISLFVNIMTAAGMTSFQISGVRMIVGAIGMALIVFLTDRSKFCIRIRDIWMFIGTGFISLTLFNICYFACMQMSEVSVAVVLLYTSPVWVMLMSAVVFRERITPKKLVALVMTFAGCALVAGVVGGAVRLSPIALAVGVAGGIFYALYSIFGNVALRSYDTMTVTFWTFAVGAVASLSLSDHVGTVAIAEGQPSLWLVFLGIGVLCTIVPFLLYTLGLKHMEAGRAAILATAEPLVGALLGIFAYGESAGPVKIIGMLLILASVILLNVGDKKPAE